MTGWQSFDRDEGKQEKPSSFSAYGECTYSII